MTEPLKPTGFWSYTSSDDSASRGRLSQLRRLLADELQLKIGRLPQVHIFQDVAAIPHGSDWHKEIHKALAEASFLIPIVTPAFLQSGMCCQEVLHFHEREAALGRDDLIFPVHYLNVDDVDPERRSECCDAAVLRLLRSRQWIDFRPLRFRDPNSEDVALKLEALAASIRAALRRPVVTVGPKVDGADLPRDGLSSLLRVLGKTQPSTGAWPVQPSPSASHPAATPGSSFHIPPAAPGSSEETMAMERPSVGRSAGPAPRASPAPRSRRRLVVWPLAVAFGLLLAASIGLMQHRRSPVQPAPPSASQAAQPSAAGSVIRDCPNCPELTLIPSGSFMMGVPPEEDDRESVARSSDDAARPQHAVTFARSFWLGRYPVTRAEYAAFVEDTGYQRGGTSWRDPGISQTGRDPVVNVSARDAEAYAEWLANKTGKAYRLPSEAEWEYAARAGSVTARFWGDDRALACWYSNVADETLRTKDQARPDMARYFICHDGYANTSPVGKFSPNGFGLYDMLGNVWQWTSDCYNRGYVGAPSDGSAWTTGECASRVMRGGSWGSNPASLRVGHRGRSSPDVRDISIGFRLARPD